MSGVRGFLGNFGIDDELLLILLFVAIFSTCWGGGLFGFGGRGGHGGGFTQNCDEKLIFYIILLILFCSCSDLFGGRVLPEGE